MGRTKEKGDTSPSTNSIVSSTTKHSSNKSKQSTTPRRGLYDDDVDSDAGEDTLTSNAIQMLVGIGKNGRDHDVNNDTVEIKAKKMKTTYVNSDIMPDDIGSDYQLSVPDNIGSDYGFNQGQNNDEMQPLMQNRLMPTYYSAENSTLHQTLKAMLINAIRTSVFRKIKFLTNEKLGMESSIFQNLYETTGLKNKVEQQAKYESIRTLIQRQMNSKRNYCTDQIMAKARGTQIVKFLSFSYKTTHSFNI
jgi:hypothetical protein